MAEINDSRGWTVTEISASRNTELSTNDLMKGVKSYHHL